jgi:hypothetical protein
MSKLSNEIKKHAREQSAADGNWLMGVPAIVADNQDPDRQHRVKVIIPSIDEDLVYDEWARQMVFCLGDGFGSAFIPPKDSEVVLFGQLGQKYNLFYASVYNEEMLVPDGFNDEKVAGVHVPGDLKLIADLLALLQGQNVNVIAAQLARITGQNIESLAQQLNKLTGQNVEITAGSEAKVTGQTIKLDGGTVRIIGNGTIKLEGGSVEVTGSSIKLHGRTVNPSGPNI